MKLSKRLELVASYVPDNSNVIDVGCDHAYLSIYLASNKKNINILATDIKKGPLESAKVNIKKYKVEDKIKLELKDGITNLNKNIDTVIISGMGGILITNILKKEELKNVKTLILSPNNDFEIVRKHLKKIGFYIEKEKLITDKNITYLVLMAKKGSKKQISLFGKLNNKDLETIYYFNKRSLNNKNIIKKLPNKYIIKKLKFYFENKRIKRFLESE